MYVQGASLKTGAVFRWQASQLPGSRTGTWSMPSLYDVLGVSPQAEGDVISAAYRALMKRYHPDRDSGLAAQERARQINQAYETLSDPEKRRAYDHVLRDYQVKQPHAPPHATSSVRPVEQAVGAHPFFTAIVNLLRFSSSIPSMLFGLLILYGILSGVFHSLAPRNPASTEASQATPSQTGTTAPPSVPDVSPLGLTIEQVLAEPSLTHGHAALAVSGVIRNVVGQSVRVPRLRLLLLNAQGRRVAGQIVNFAADAIPPGESRGFATTILDPPFSAHDLRVEFAPGARGAATVTVRTSPPS